MLTLQRYLQIEGVEIKALCEIREGNLSKAQQLLKEADRSKGQTRVTPEQIERNIGISKDYNNFELRSAIVEKAFLSA